MGSSFYGRYDTPILGSGGSTCYNPKDSLFNFNSFGSSKTKKKRRLLGEVQPGTTPTTRSRSGSPVDSTISLFVKGRNGSRGRRASLYSPPSPTKSEKGHKKKRPMEEAEERSKPGRGALSKARQVLNFEKAPEEESKLPSSSIPSSSFPSTSSTPTRSKSPVKKKNSKQLPSSEKRQKQPPPPQETLPRKKKRGRPRKQVPKNTVSTQLHPSSPSPPKRQRLESPTNNAEFVPPQQIEIMSPSLPMEQPGSESRNLRTFPESPPVVPTISSATPQKPPAAAAVPRQLPKTASPRSPSISPSRKARSPSPQAQQKKKSTTGLRPGPASKTMGIAAVIPRAQMAPPPPPWQRPGPASRKHRPSSISPPRSKLISTSSQNFTDEKQGSPVAGRKSLPSSPASLLATAPTPIISSSPFDRALLGGESSPPTTPRRPLSSFIEPIEKASPSPVALPRPLLPTIRPCFVKLIRCDLPPQPSVSCGDLPSQPSLPSPLDEVNDEPVNNSPSVELMIDEDAVAYSRLANAYAANKLKVTLAQTVRQAEFCGSNILDNPAFEPNTEKGVSFAGGLIAEDKLSMGYLRIPPMTCYGFTRFDFCDKVYFVLRGQVLVKSTGSWYDREEVTTTRKYLKSKLVRETECIILKHGTIFSIENHTRQPALLGETTHWLEVDPPEEDPEDVKPEEPRKSESDDLENTFQIPL